METTTLEQLIHKYTEKANYHGFEAILGNPTYRKYHETQERLYDRLIVKIGEKYLREAKHG